MTDDEHTLACWARVYCKACNRPKAPRGRSVPLAAAGGYCTHDCPGYDEKPLAGHFWPEEEPALKAKVTR